MQLWKRFTELFITRKLTLGQGATLELVGANGAITTIDLVELAAIDAVGAADLAKIDGITNGTPAAGKALVLDANSAIGSFNLSSKIIGTQAAPATATDTATLTDAQHLSGILVATPTAAAAYTTLTGALLDDAVLAAFPTFPLNGTFDLTIINIGGTGDDITLTAGASGITLVGEAIIRPVADSATDGATGQGTFRHRRTAADTWIIYRVA